MGKLYDDTKEISKSKQCCAGQDILDAKRVAHKLGIEHKILYYQNQFKSGVIDEFVSDPCFYLVNDVKWGCLSLSVRHNDLYNTRYPTSLLLNIYGNP